MKNNLFLIAFLCCAFTGFGQAVHSLKSHGYLRTGFGHSLSGGEMVQFRVPNTLVKSRFGNEANHYSELQFNYKYSPKDRNDAYEIVYMMDTYLPYTSKNLVQSIKAETAQLYFKWHNFYKNAHIWLGRRYYQRENIDILDWFWLNSGQNADIGAGIENLILADKMNLNIAILRFSDKIKDPSIDTNNPEVNNGLFEDYKLDIRLKEISLNKNLYLTILGQLGLRTGIKNTPYQGKTGYALGGWTTYRKGNFYNRTSAIFRKGINMVAHQYTGRGFTEINAQGDTVYNLNKAHDLQIVSDIQYDDNDKNGFLGAVTYQYKDYGIKTIKNNEKTYHHLNVTGRYSRYISNRFALTFDAGYDYVYQKEAFKGRVFKITFSPEIKWKKGMFSRPSIRPFITYASWSDDLKGKVGIFNGNEVYKNKTHGFTAGLQLELWW